MELLAALSSARRRHDIPQWRPYRVSVQVPKVRPNCKRALGVQSETNFRYVFAHRDDRNREMVLSVLAFDIPS